MSTEKIHPEDQKNRDLAARALVRAGRDALELDFWRYQAIWHRALVLLMGQQPKPEEQKLLIDSPIWNVAKKQLEKQLDQEDLAAWKEIKKGLRKREAKKRLEEHKRPLNRMPPRKCTGKMAAKR